MGKKKKKILCSIFNSYHYTYFWKKKYKLFSFVCSFLYFELVYFQVLYFSHFWSFLIFITNMQKKFALHLIQKAKHTKCNEISFSLSSSKSLLRHFLSVQTPNNVQLKPTKVLLLFQLTHVWGFYFHFFLYFEFRNPIKKIEVEKKKTNWAFLTCTLVGSETAIQKDNTLSFLNVLHLH